MFKKEGHAIDATLFVRNLNHWLMSTQFDPFAWRPDGVRMPGCPLRTYVDMCTMPFLGAGVL